MIYITHRLGEVFEICDSVTVLRNGEHVATTEVAELDRRQLVSMMLGRPLEAMYPPQLKSRPLTLCSPSRT